MGNHIHHLTRRGTGRYIYAVACALLLLLPGVVQAQGAPSNIYVQRVIEIPAQPGTDGVLSYKLGALFTLLDSTGLPIAAEIERVELQVGSDRYTGTFGKVAGELGIAILIDTSATMAGSSGDFARMMEGLTRAIDRAPEGALITLLTFDNTAVVRQEFTADKEALRKTLAGIRPRAGSKSCLNTGLQEAVRRVQNARRSAVLAITASQDTCGDVSLQAVLQETENSKTMIYALGVGGYAVNLANLEQYTGPTAGLAYVRFPNDLIFGFSSVFTALANQWEANWTLFPPKGEQRANLTVTLKDTQQLQGEVSFLSDQDYVPPPRIELVGEVRSLRDSIVANLNITNRAMIAVFKATVIDNVTGKSVLDQSVTPEGDSISLPASALIRDGKYTLQLAALDVQNRVLSQIEPREFEYKPQTLQISIANVSVPTLQSAFFVVTVTTSFGDTAGIARYKLWMEQNQQDGPIAQTEVLLDPTGQLRIPAEGLPSGKYQVKAQALDGANVVIAEAARPFEVTYTAFGFMDTLTDRMRGSPEIVVILAVLALAALVGFFFVIRTSRARSRMAVNVVEPALPDRVMSAGPSRVMIDPEHARKRAPQQPADSGIMARPRALAQLVMREPTTPPYTASISQPRFTLGRAPDNNGALPVDSGSGVSGHHAIVLQEQGEWYVQDAQSTNGTFINGRKLAKGSRERLQNGAVIGLGPKVKVEFRVQP